LGAMPTGARPYGGGAAVAADGGLAAHSIWGGAYAAAQQQQQQQVAARPPPPPPPPPPPASAALEDAFRPLAAHALAMRVGAALGAHRVAAQGELDRLLAQQRALRQRDADLRGLVESVQREREGTEGLVAQLGAQVGALEGWLAVNEPRVAAVRRRAGLAEGEDEQQNHDPSAVLAAAAPDAGALVVPSDDLSRQMLAAQAEDLALEDALGALDSALLHGRLLTPAAAAAAAGAGGDAGDGSVSSTGAAVDAYLRTTRALARRQFFARARTLKVAEMQRQRGEGGGGVAGAVTLGGAAAGGGARAPLASPSAAPAPGAVLAGSGGSGSAYPKLPT